jgi:hypothetical protein
LAVAPPGCDGHFLGGSVVDDRGRLGRVWREADVEATDLKTAIQDVLEGVIGFFAGNRK